MEQLVFFLKLLKYGGMMFLPFTFILVGSQIVAQTQVEKGDGPNKPSTINL